MILALPWWGSYVIVWFYLLWFCQLFLLEIIRPLRRRKRVKRPRLVVNFFFTALGFAVGLLTVRPVAFLTSAWADAHSFGLLHLLKLPLWFQVAGGILLMDLTFYYWHRLNHTQRLLWRFHGIHHLDPDMDVSTSFRFHWGEVLYSTVFRVLQVGLLGILPGTYLLYEMVFNCATMFHHSNLRLPLGGERLVNRIFVTPRMHGVHHSVIGRETNSNYSVIFSWWDRLNRSLRLNVPQGDIIIGVPGYLLPQDNRIRNLLKYPFLRQRPYWRWPGGKTVAPRRPAEPAPTDVLAE